MAYQKNNTYVKVRRMRSKDFWYYWRKKDTSLFYVNNIKSRPNHPTLILMNTSGRLYFKKYENMLTKLIWKKTKMRGRCTHTLPDIQQCRTKMTWHFFLERYISLGVIMIDWQQFISLYYQTLSWKKVSLPRNTGVA